MDQRIQRSFMDGQKGVAMNERTDIKTLKGIGEKTAALFHRLEIRTVGDLLHDYPGRYDFFGEPRKPEDVVQGELCAVRGFFSGNLTVRKAGRLTLFSFSIKDGSGELWLTYFNTPYIKNILKRGMLYIFRGVAQCRNGRMIMEQPRLFTPEEYAGYKGRLQPCYGLTAGLSNHMRTKAVRQALSLYLFPDEPLPERLLQEEELISYQKAMKDIHFPESQEDMLSARKRLVFDEFFYFLLALRQCREQNKKTVNQVPMKDSSAAESLLQQLPYSLTEDQQQVWKEIRADLQGEHVMNRLVQGDVGSGKTILAFLALVMSASAGYQGAMMAPTEVLARQHYEQLVQMKEAYGLPVVPILLTGSMSAKEKRLAREEIQNGTVNVILGTHALIQETVAFQNLALVITDEQHRFGVRQRETLAEKGRSVHVMVMSATPIPRTLALILYGDLDLSVIHQLPGGRLPIKNCVVGTGSREASYRFMEKEIRQGRQVYVICPMVEEGELEGAENVLTYTEKLRSRMPSDLRIESLHGKMKPAEKNRIMESYGAHEIDILVSTTVIEVGINVPNATVMMVENAERFGLAQLHQLRGRVGRGSHQSYCIFVSGSEKKETLERLEVLRTSNDGFYISEKDMELRGPGDLFGIRQSGMFEFAIGDIFQDAGLLKRAEAQVNRLLEEDPGLTDPEHEKIRHFMLHRWRMVDFPVI